MAEGHGEEVGWFDQLVANIRECHALVLETSGGAAGEHTARLLASCARPFQSAFGEDAFADDVERAAALFHGIIAGHAFVDGNKRTATITAILFLIARGHLTDKPTTIQVRLLGEVAVETAMSRLDVRDVADWLHRIFDP
ncbi:MAG: type II toxin-antitoxin system death-on-curing family toxin [Dehalococcoidia bacterium]